jgi:hypothetical protein
MTYYRNFVENLDNKVFADNLSLDKDNYISNNFLARDKIYMGVRRVPDRGVCRRAPLGLPMSLVLPLRAPDDLHKEACL